MPHKLPKPIAQQLNHANNEIHVKSSLGIGCRSLHRSIMYHINVEQI